MKGVELYGRVRYAVQIEGLSERRATKAEIWPANQGGLLFPTYFGGDSLPRLRYGNEHDPPIFGAVRASTGNSRFKP